MNGHASRIGVTLHADGASVTITDDGRGIPIDQHKKSKRSALEVIFTTLHAGGKFEHGTYRTAGGLHGVGASVVNALSKELVATSRRDGAEWEQRFAQGKPVGKLHRMGGARGSGTTVYFRPDATIFPKTTFDTTLIADRLETASYLHKGVKVVFEDESTGEGRVFQHDEGLIDYLRRILADRNTPSVHTAPFTIIREHEATNTRLDLALQWTESTD
ncbi:MAG: ATP-binding protein, partial [Vicinamibacterales bacterium]|nr:ATP-binding protein [Vicinamibacterales bacterium]